MPMMTNELHVARCIHPQVIAQRGASLIEVMVAVMIVGFALLGMGGMQAKAIQMNQGSYYRGVAADLGADLADRIRALNSPYLASTDATRQPPKPPDFSTCVPNRQGGMSCQQESDVTSYPGAHRSSFQASLEREMDEWNKFRESQLPAGSTYSWDKVDLLATNRFRYTLTMSWRETWQKASDPDLSYTVEIE